LTSFFDVLLGGVFHASVLFLVAAGLQLVFGVQRIVNLACGSFYALGAFFGITAVNWAIAHGAPPWAFLPVLVLAGHPARGDRPVHRAAAAHRLQARRGVPAAAHLRPGPDVPGRAALLLGRQPAAARQPVDELRQGRDRRGVVPDLQRAGDGGEPGIAVGLGLFLQRTRYGRILRATAENREMAEALGADVRWIYASVFTLGHDARHRRRRARRARPPRLRSTCRWSSSSRRSRWS
jgi:branched-chain amino acid transport system permease protein